MNNSDETKKQPLENNAILQAIADLSKTVGEISNKLDRLENRLDKLEDRFDKLESRFDKLEIRFDKLEIRFDKLEDRFDKLENFVTVQFDAVQEGIAYNSAKFDRLEAKFYDARSDISNLRADIKELTQVVRKKEFV